MVVSLLVKVDWGGGGGGACKEPTCKLEDSDGSHFYLMWLSLIYSLRYLVTRKEKENRH